MAQDLATIAFLLQEKIKNTINQKLASKGIDDLSFHHGEIFKIIYESPDNLTMIEIAKKIGRSRSDLTLLTNKMIKSGWIAKTPDPNDKRKIFLKLTQKSHDILPLFLNVGKEIQAKAELIIDPTTLHALEGELLKIINIL